MVYRAIRNLCLYAVGSQNRYLHYHLACSTNKIGILNQKNSAAKKAQLRDWPLAPCRCSSQSVSDRQVEALKNIKMPTMNGATILKFAKLTDKAYAPMKGSKYAAGYDLRSAYEYTVPARSKELVKTDLQIEVPDGTYGRIAPRSGLAWKNSIDVGAGVIDADYRGNVGVVLFNLGNEDFKISPGDRVAQLICEKIVYPELEELDTLNNTERGEGGFGSTGKN